MLLLSIVNENLAVATTPGQPAPLVEGGGMLESHVAVDETAARVSAWNASEGRWGVLEDSPEMIVARERARAEEDAAAGKAAAAAVRAHD